MRIIKYLALISVFLPSITTALAEEAKQSAGQLDYFTQERYLESNSVAIAGADSRETTGDDSFLSSSVHTAPKKSGGFISAGRVVLSAYSSTPDQTDSTPFIMASGKHVYDGAIASNFLPLGTLVRIPELFGGKIFVVEDRMHKRFSDRVDVWMETRQEAINFGLRSAAIEVLF